MFNPFKKKPKVDESFSQPLSPEADQFLATACAEYQAKRDALLNGEWRLASCSDWGFEPETGVVTVQFADGSHWQAAGQFLGSFHVKTNTWQWAWDSPDLPESLSRDSNSLRQVGEQFGIRYLTLGGGAFPLPDAEFVEYLCALGLKATDSTGVMEADAGESVGFLMLKDLKCAQSAA